MAKNPKIKKKPKIAKKAPAKAPAKGAVDGTDLNALVHNAKHMISMAEDDVHYQYLDILVKAKIALELRRIADSMGKR